MHSNSNLTYRAVLCGAYRDACIFAVRENAYLADFADFQRAPRYSPAIDDTLKKGTHMDDSKLQIARTPLGAVEQISTHPVSFAAALARKDLNSRHSAITADLYSYHRYKMWTAKIRNAFEAEK